MGLGKVEEEQQVELGQERGLVLELGQELVPGQELVLPLVLGPF